MRESGYYWIKVNDNEGRGDIWIIAKYRNDKVYQCHGWIAAELDHEFYDDEIVEICETQINIADSVEYYK